MSTSVAVPSVWVEHLRDAGRVALDTNARIYFLDESPGRYHLVRAAFLMTEAGELEIVIPSLVEMELVVGLLRSEDHTSLARLDLLLDRFKGVSIAPFDREAARSAASLRAAFSLSTPDAVVIGTAIAAGCQAVVGNDRACASRVSSPKYLLLDRFAA